ncbi:MAG: D-alanine--D-alanine ligase [Magnetococcales bacterium]|nr:D-alanine--D-alanine ligase [Magnetococcales bacterium]
MLNARDLNIAVLMGGTSDERAVSLKSGAAMTAALERKKYRVMAMDAGRSLAADLLREGIELAVIALHGSPGEDGTVQGMLEIMGIPYTGSGVLSSALCMDKGMTKRVLRQANIPTPDWREIAIQSPEDVEKVAGSFPEPPLYIKPLASGSSVGISRIMKPEDIGEGLALAARYSKRILVEQGIRGVEVTLPVLNGEPLPLIEIRPKTGFYDFQNKYTVGATEYLIPPPSLTGAAMEEATRVGVAAYLACQCQGLARVDVMVDEQGGAWVLEINTIPGMTETSLAPKSAQAAGISFDDLVERILLDAVKRSCGETC